MTAIPGRLPVHKHGWAWEMRWAGVRALAVVDADGLTLRDSGGRPITDAYPDLAALADRVGRRRLVLDGVIGGYQPQDGPKRARAACYRVFDVLALDGQDLTGESYLTRRTLLASLDLDRPPAVQVPPHYRDLAGPDLASLARRHGVDGIVGKRLSSPYQPGRRSQHWIELALLRGCEAVIGGWIPGHDDEHDRLDSVLLGVYDQARRLVYIGRVGTGFTNASRRALRSALQSIPEDECPFDAGVPSVHIRRSRWVRPTLVADVNYRAITPDGRLHQPSWRGIRTDIDPQDPIWSGSLRLQLQDLVK